TRAPQTETVARSPAPASRPRSRPGAKASTAAPRGPAKVLACTNDNDFCRGYNSYVARLRALRKDFDEYQRQAYRSFRAEGGKALDKHTAQLLSNRLFELSGEFINRLAREVY